MKVFSKGFTLVEVMVVVTIMGVLIMMGVAAYNNFNRNQRVRQSAEAIMTAMRSAQKSADRSERPSTGTCDVLEGYRVDDVTASQISISAYCDNIVGGLTDVNTQTFNVPNNTEVAGFPAGGFVFRTLSQGISDNNLVGIGGNVVLNITLAEGGANVASVTVSRGGSIDAWWP